MMPQLGDLGSAAAQNSAEFQGYNALKVKVLADERKRKEELRAASGQSMDTQSKNIILSGTEIFRRPGKEDKADVFYCRKFEFVQKDFWVGEEQGRGGGCEVILKSADRKECAVEG